MSGSSLFLGCLVSSPESRVRSSSGTKKSLAGNWLPVVARACIEELPAFSQRFQFCPAVRNAGMGLRLANLGLFSEHHRSGLRQSMLTGTHTSFSFP